jgi:hypothetical protein
MSRAFEDETRQPMLRARGESVGEGVAGVVSDGLRARPRPSDTHASPLPHGNGEVPRWGRLGSRDNTKETYAVWCELHGAPVGIAVWLVVLFVMGVTFPLSRVNAVPGTDTACAVLLCVSLVAMTLVNRLDPGIIAPSATNDPLIEHLDALALVGTSHGNENVNENAEALAVGVRKDPVSGQYARLAYEFRTQDSRYGGGDVEAGGSGRGVGDGGDAGDTNGVFSETPVEMETWDWSKCERYCRTCRIWRPPRAAHCRDCGWCVIRFDHHCGALGNCVGRDNHRWFVLCLCSVSGLVVVLAVESVAALRDANWPRAKNSFSDPIVVTLLACVIVYGSCACLSCFAISHVYLWLCDVTTKEVLRPRRGCEPRSADADIEAGPGAERWRRLCGGLDVGEHGGLRRLLKHFTETALCAGCTLKSVTTKRLEERLESRSR